MMPPFKAKPLHTPIHLPDLHTLSPKSLYTANLFCQVHYDGNIISAWIMFHSNVFQKRQGVSWWLGQMEGGQTLTPETS